MLSYLSDAFVTASGDLRFLTLKGEGKYQKIDTVRRLCAKIAKSYIIVRERNKIIEGYHFHALLKVEKEPTKSWFKKGVHMNLKKVGRPQTMEGFRLPMPEITVREKKEALYEGTLTPEDVEDMMVKDLEKKVRKQCAQRRHVDRILLYMSKELELPAQYLDYILVIGGKNLKIQI